MHAYHLKDPVDADFHTYLDSWSQELLARSNRVRQLIGSAHWLSDGHHKEEILREFVCRYLPPGLVVARGFVKTTQDLRVCSPEADILVTDPGSNPPFFNEGSLQIVDGSAVLAQIEVKTTFSTAKLTEALSNVSRVQNVVRTSRQKDTWSGVYFFTGTADMDSPKLLQTLDSAVKKAAAEANENGNPFVLPTCLATLDRYCVFFEPIDANSARCKLLETSSLGFPCAFADMFAAIRRANGGPVVGGLDNVIEGLSLPDGRIHQLSW